MSGGNWLLPRWVILEQLLNRQFNPPLTGRKTNRRRVTLKRTVIEVVPMKIIQLGEKAKLIGR